MTSSALRKRKPRPRKRRLIQAVSRLFSQSSRRQVARGAVMWMSLTWASRTAARDGRGWVAGWAGVMLLAPVPGHLYNFPDLRARGGRSGPPDDRTARAEARAGSPSL